jgi:uncharacterized membrane protein
MSGLLGIFFASLTALFKSSSSIISKELLDTDVNPYVSSWALRIFAIPALIPALYITGGVPDLDPVFYPLLLLNTGIGVLGTIFYMKALNVGDISLVDPISALSPLLLLITTPLIVNEFPSPLGLVGVMIIVCGVYLLKLQKVTGSDTFSKDTVLSPFYGIVNEPATKYIVLMILVYSISAPVDKIIIEASGPIMYSLSLHICQSIILTGVAIYMTDSWRSDMFSRETIKLSPIGVLSGLASMFQMIALTYTLVVYVISIKRLGILIGTIWGIFVRGEEGGIPRLIGSGLIIAGTIFISVAL